MSVKQKPKKISIDFGIPEHALLTKEASRKGISNSSVVNELIATFCTLPPDIKSDLCKFCEEKKRECRAQESESFSDFEIENRYAKWMNLTKYFTVSPDEYLDNGMRKIFLKAGYVIFPKNYVVLEDLGSYEEHKYCGVLACRNDKKYDVPVFMFPCDYRYAKDYTDELEETVLQSVKKVFPRITELWNMQSNYDIFKDGYDEKKADEYFAAPQFGFFHIVVKGDPLYWNSVNPNYRPPDGAMICRPEGYKEEEE